jgi:hypothetical protein
VKKGNGLARTDIAVESHHNAAGDHMNLAQSLGSLSDHAVAGDEGGGGDVKKNGALNSHPAGNSHTDRNLPGVDSDTALCPTDGPVAGPSSRRSETGNDAALKQQDAGLTRPPGGPSNSSSKGNYSYTINSISFHHSARIYPFESSIFCIFCVFILQS